MSETEDLCQILTSSITQTASGQAAPGSILVGSDFTVTAPLVFVELGFGVFVFVCVFMMAGGHFFLVFIGHVSFFLRTCQFRFCIHFCIELYASIIRIIYIFYERKFKNIFMLRR